ncbi:MAG: hypothetical protein SPF22_03870 [Candidatus Onthovivens sp.]|nr:hypothetical protein [Candidatus Onthovivens sp.]
MKLEEKLTKLGFTQNLDIPEQWNNRELDVSVYVGTGKIVDIQICKDWVNIHKFHDCRDYESYLTRVRYLFNELNKIL